MTEKQYTFKDIEQVETFVVARIITDRMQKDDNIKNLDSATSARDIAERMYQHFLAFYDEMHKGRSEYDKREIVNGIEKKFQTRFLEDSEKEKIKEAFIGFSNDLFDAEAKPKTLEKPAHAVLYDLYQQLEQTALYDTETAFGVFAVMLNYNDKFSSAFPRGIDFTRANKESSLPHRFKEALENKRKKPDITYSEFIKPPGGEQFPDGTVESGVTNPSYMTIEGLRFAIHKSNDPDFYGRTYFVLENGRLIDSTDEVREQIAVHVRNKKSLSQLKFVPSEKSLADYIAPDDQTTTAAKATASKVKKAIHALNNDEPACLFCIDQDKLTSLRMVKDQDGIVPLDSLKKFIKESGYPKGFVDILKGAEKHADGVQAHITEQLEKLTQSADRKAAAGNNYPYLILERAKPRLEEMLLRAWEASSEAFERRSGGLDVPKAIMPLGVSGSGKSSVKKIADAETSKNIVEASLDDGRLAAGDLYWLNIATANHRHDYKDFGEFGELVRNIIIHRAVEGRYNLFVDGSGLPWKGEGRNGETAAMLKGRGYEVSVIKTSTPFFDPDMHDNITLRLGSRGVDEGRYVPIDIVIKKLSEEPKAAIDAERDPNVDHYSIVDTANIQVKPYRLQFEIEGTLETIHKLKILRDTPVAMKEYLEQEKYMPSHIEWDTTKPANFRVTRQREGGRYLIDIVTNTEHYVRDAMKGLLCLHDLDHPERTPKGPESLLVHALKFDVCGQFQSPEGMLIIEPGERKKNSWPEYHPISRSTPVSLAETRSQAQSTDTQIG